MNDELIKEKSNALLKELVTSISCFYAKEDSEEEAFLASANSLTKLLIHFSLNAYETRGKQIQFIDEFCANTKAFLEDIKDSTDENNH